MNTSVIVTRIIFVLAETRSVNQEIIFSSNLNGLNIDAPFILFNVLSKINHRVHRDNLTTEDTEKDSVHSQRLYSFFYI